jgi:putative SOS response-associated peptidase YedK
MCGRYTLSRTDDLPGFFEVSEVRLPPRFNIAPTQPAPVVRLDLAGTREAAMPRWGLIPHWRREPVSGAPMINARAETVHQKPAFRDAFRERRCLVPADGFYEWRRVEGRSQPYLFTLRGGGLFAFAGLWDRFLGEDTPIESFSIVTCSANDLVAKIHDRMPVILPRDRFDAWLAGPPSLAARLLVPFDPETMRSVAVSPLVNNPRNDGEECLRPLPFG